jgi:hypothetical protein
MQVLAHAVNIGYEGVSHLQVNLYFLVNFLQDKIVVFISNFAIGVELQRCEDSECEAFG